MKNKEKGIRRKGVSQWLASSELFNKEYMEYIWCQ